MKTPLLCAVILNLACGFALGQAQYKVLYNFQHSDGSVPEGSLVLDGAGNLYGTTGTGGIQGTCYGGGCGVIFELSPNSDGSWSETVLYDFCPGSSGFDCPDGAFAETGLALDSYGNLYGVTELGGLCLTRGASGCGVAFKLSPPSSPGGVWTYDVLYRFCSILENDTCVDGSTPLGPPILDANGNLYGTTLEGGSQGGGTVFELSPSAGGWTEAVLYNFCSTGAYCSDGLYPRGTVAFDMSGNLYGTTTDGGNPTLHGAGTVYKLSPGSGGWTETVLFAFSPSKSQPQNPYGLSIDPAGNLYMPFGTGKKGYGGVGRISHGTLRAFIFDGNDGDYANSGLLVDSRRRRLYGTTSGGNFSYGNVFQIDASGQETVLHTFCQPDCSYGEQPLGGLIEDKVGNLYGTTAVGGTTENGVVFELTP